jgi:Domain of unknown function (DUF5666)
MKYHTIAIASLVLPFLAACGQTATTVPASSVVSGAITAMASDYSSITVAGQTLKLSSSSLSAASLSAASLNAASLNAKADAPSTAAPAKKAKHVRVNGKETSEKALSVGQKVKIKVEDGQASEIDVDLEVRGAITAIDTVAGTIVVAGRMVKLPTGARVDLDGDDDTAEKGKGKEALANLKVGDFVEVTGTTDANGDVVASKIEVKGAKELEDDNQDDHNEFRGKVSGFVTGATTFTLRNITVTCADPCVIPATIKDGVVAEVEGKFTAEKALDASSVKLLEGKSAEDQHEGPDDDRKPDDGKPDDKSGSGK